MTLVQKVRKSGNSYIVTIPKAEMQRLNLRLGQLVGVQVQPLEMVPVLRPELREAFEAEFAGSEDALHYLATH